MARVGKALALVSFVLSLTLPFGTLHAQTPDAKAEETKKKRTPPSKKAGEQKAATSAADAKKAADPSAVQKSLDLAQKALDGGKAEVAVNQINSLIGLGGLDSRSMARALALRGQAYRRQNKPAQAISDLQSAIWLKGGLSEAERATALQARAEAYREAGLGEPPGAAAGRSSASAANQKTANSANLATAAVQPKASAAPSQTSGGFFSNLFGGNTSKSAPAEPSPVKAPADPAVSSWSTQGAAPTGAKAATASIAQPKASAAAPPVKTVAVTPPAVPKAPEASAATGGFKIQLAAMRTREEAQALVDRVKKELAAQLGNRPHGIDEAKFGNSGVFFRPRFEAFASASEAKTVCAALRGKGIDCLAAD